MEHLEFTVLVQSKHTLLVYPMKYGLFARDTVRDAEKLSYPARSILPTRGRG